MSYPIFKFEAELFKHSITDLAKFLGGSPGPINIKIDQDTMELSQASQVSSARLVLKKSEFELFGEVDGLTLTAIDPVWIKSALSKASKTQHIEMKITDTQCQIGWGRHQTTASTLPFDETAAPIVPDDPLSVHSEIIQFVRRFSSVLKMKPYFSTRPLAATIGTLDRHPFLLVNDQYHGLIIISPDTIKRDIEKFSMDSAAVAAMAFDPKTNEIDQAKLRLTITEGRVILNFPNISYEIPAFEPSAIPSTEEIAGIVKMGRKGKRSHHIEMNAFAMSEAASFSRRGEDASQSFFLKYSNDLLRCVYSSATIDSRCEVVARKKKWGGDITVDPNMLAEIVDQISGLNKHIFSGKDSKSEDAVLGEQFGLLMNKDSNVLMFVHGLANNESYPSAYGFVVTGG